MKLLVHTENEKVLKSLKDAAYSLNHEVELLAEQDISSAINFQNADVFVVDKKTWQRSASIFKYFTLLGEILRMPIVVLSNEGRQGHLKFLENNSNVQVCGLPVRSEELNSVIEHLNRVGAEV